ncbi:MAG: tetratricopeptide repeat protein [Elusimicrobia bacterium]|nr:tetratricopeptide repeat protein [Elusimicrobiota bacterium]
MTPGTTRRLDRMFPLLLAASVLLTYAHTLHVGFYFDDSYTILSNPAVHSLKNVFRYFYDPYAVSPVRSNFDVRPLFLLSCALNWAVSGPAPWSYHVVNIALHLLNAWLVFVIARDHLWKADSNAVPAAASASLFFALAPLNTQAVNYMHARSGLLATTFYLIAFLEALRGRGIRSAAWLACALLSKAIAVTFPASLFAYAWIYRATDRRFGDWKRAAVWLAPSVVLTLLYVVYRWAVLPAAVSQPQDPSLTPWIWLMTQSRAHLHYVRQFVWPDRLSLSHDAPYVLYRFFADGAWLYFSLIGGWVLTALLVSRRQPQAAFGTAWFFITLSPESTLIPGTEVINDHRPYIATSLGLAVLLAWGLRRLSGPSRRAFLASAALLAAAGAGSSGYRNWQWRDSLVLWVDAARKEPKSLRANMNAGVALMARGRLAEARPYLERARENAPRWAYTHANLAVLSLAEGRLSEALEAAESAVRTGPDLALSYFHRGQVLQRMGRGGEAAGDFAAAQVVEPGHPASLESLKRLGLERDPEPPMRAGLRFYYEMRRSDLAERAFRTVLEKRRDHYGAHYQLASVLDSLGRHAEARSYWEKVLPLARRYGDSVSERTARERLRRTP